MQINVLIVDDIEANLYALESILNELEVVCKEECLLLKCIKALSGAEALSWIFRCQR